jgi:hypothetical protein
MSAIDPSVLDTGQILPSPPVTSQTILSSGKRPRESAMQEERDSETNKTFLKQDAQAQTQEHGKTLPHSHAHGHTHGVCNHDDDGSDEEEDDDLDYGSDDSENWVSHSKKQGAKLFISADPPENAMAHGIDGAIAILESVRAQMAVHVPMIVTREFYYTLAIHIPHVIINDEFATRVVASLRFLVGRTAGTNTNKMARASAVLCANSKLDMVEPKSKEEWCGSIANVHEDSSRQSVYMCRYCVPKIVQARILINALAERGNQKNPGAKLAYERTIDGLMAMENRIFSDDTFAHLPLLAFAREGETK